MGDYSQDREMARRRRQKVGAPGTRRPRAKPMKPQRPRAPGNGGLVMVKMADGSTQEMHWRKAKRIERHAPE